MLDFYSKGAAQANNLFVLTETFNKLSPKTPDNLIPSIDKALYDSKLFPNKKNDIKGIGFCTQKEVLRAAIGY
jgi:hypothetical protein